MSTEKTEDQANNADKNKRNCFPKEISLRYDTEPINELTHAINQQTANQEQEKSNPQSLANRQAKAQERANDIYRKSLYVNTFIFLATLGIFWFTIRSANAAKEAADAAKGAVDQYKRANDFTESNAKSAESTNRIFLDRATKSADAAKESADALAKADSTAERNYKLAYTAYESSILDAKKRFKIDSSNLAIGDSNYIKSVDVATKTMEITKSNFETANKSYIFLINAKIDSLGINRPEQITIQVENFGKMPAQILMTKTGSSLDADDTSLSLDYPQQNIRSENFFLPPNATFTLPYQSFIVDSAFYTKIMTASRFFHIYGEIIYYDIATNKKYSYGYYIRILNNGRFAPTKYNNRFTEIY
ncbi:MAG TPA: hypothetical protein VIH61_05280 [Waddliaceae bacterium]